MAANQGGSEAKCCQWREGLAWPLKELHLRSTAGRNWWHPRIEHRPVSQSASARSVYSCQQETQFGAGKQNSSMGQRGSRRNSAAVAGGDHQALGGGGGVRRSHSVPLHRHHSAVHHLVKQACERKGAAHHRAHAHQQAQQPRPHLPYVNHDRAGIAAGGTRGGGEGGREAGRHGGQDAGAGEGALLPPASRPPSGHAGRPPSRPPPPSSTGVRHSLEQVHCGRLLLAAPELVVVLGHAVLVRVRLAAPQGVEVGGDLRAVPEGGSTDVRAVPPWVRDAWAPPTPAAGSAGRALGGRCSRAQAAARAHCDCWAQHSHHFDKVLVDSGGSAVDLRHALQRVGLQGAGR